jgi:hypothetical protein
MCPDALSAACHTDVPDGPFCIACGASQGGAAAGAGMSMQPTVAVGSSGSGSDEGRFPAGTILSERYRILGFLGRGGMGEVYRASGLTLDQIVALKFLPPAASNDPRLLERFRAEVRLARQVSHRSVCRVHDIGDADGSAFISMEYVDGDTLANLLRQIGRLPGDKALEIARKLCAGLAAAHERGVLHRDPKPGNVMIDRQGQVRIMDFGLAAAAGGIAGGDIRSGTPAYMAPEQKEGREVTIGYGPESVCLGRTCTSLVVCACRRAGVRLQPHSCLHDGNGRRVCRLGRRRAITVLFPLGRRVDRLDLALLATRRLVINGSGGRDALRRRLDAAHARQDDLLLPPQQPRGRVRRAVAAPG